jgi:hypothetical protein
VTCSYCCCEHPEGVECTVEDLKAQLRSERDGDPLGDLIRANKQAISGILREGLQRVRKTLSDWDPACETVPVDKILAIVRAASNFHPMHAEDFKWPE